MPIPRSIGAHYRPGQRNCRTSFLVRWMDRRRCSGAVRPSSGERRFRGGLPLVSILLVPGADAIGQILGSFACPRVRGNRTPSVRTGASPGIRRGFSRCRLLQAKPGAIDEKSCAQQGEQDHGCVYDVEKKFHGALLSAGTGRSDIRSLPSSGRDREKNGGSVNRPSRRARPGPTCHGGVERLIGWFARNCGRRRHRDGAAARRLLLRVGIGVGIGVAELPGTSPGDRRTSGDRRNHQKCPQQFDQRNMHDALLG